MARRPPFVAEMNALGSGPGRSFEPRVVIKKWNRRPANSINGRAIDSGLVGGVVGGWLYILSAVGLRVRVLGASSNPSGVYVSVAVLYWWGGGRLSTCEGERGSVNTQTGPVPICRANTRLILCVQCAVIPPNIGASFRFHPSILFMNPSNPWCIVFYGV